MNSSRAARPARLTALIAIALAIAVLVSVATARGGDATPTQVGEANAKQTIVFVSWGGAYGDALTKAFINPYQKRNPNVRIVQDGTDYAKLKAMVEAGKVTWDLVTVEQDFGLKRDEKYLERIDCRIVPCRDLQPDKYLTTGYRAALDTGSVVLGYNREAMPDGRTPRGWKDFFDTVRFPGKRVILADVRAWIIELALVGDGVPATRKALYPLDVGRALRKFDSIRDALILSESSQECAELVGAGEAVMGACPNGRFYNAAKAGSPIAIQWNQHMHGTGFLVIPKGAPNKRAAMKLLAYMTSAEHNANESNFVPYGPANIKALRKVRPSVRPHLASSHLKQGVIVNDAWWDANRARVIKRFEIWKRG